MSAAIAPGRRASDRLLTIATGPLLLLTPFVNFVCHNGYPLYRPEMLACLAMFGAIGLGLGALMAAGGALLQVPITAALITLFVDVQTEWIRAWNWPLARVFLAAVLGAWVLRRHLSGILTMALTGMMLTTVVTGQRSRAPLAAGTTAPAARPGLPPLVHIVLDEHIGVEGIPREFDPDGVLAAMLRAFYAEHGFQLFGKAYSRYFDTDASLSQALNFRSSRKPREFLKRGYINPTVLARSRYFETMTRRGYVLRVYQSDYMNFCDVSPRVPIAACETYLLERLTSFQEAPLAVTEKMKLISGMYVRLSFLLTRAQRSYRATRTRQSWAHWLPDWPTAGRVSSVSVAPVFERLVRDVTQAPDGTMFFAHFMLPHYPYAYDQNCDLRPSVRNWSQTLAGGRAGNYPRYLEQVACVHKMLGTLFERMRTAGIFEDAIVVVHGDHGSRLFGVQPQPTFTQWFKPTAYIDAFSTLFAIKVPGQPPGFDNRMLPLDRLLDSFAKWNRIRAGTAWAGPPLVYIRDRSNPAVPLPQRMPRFADGAPG